MFVCPECGQSADAAGACARDGAARVDQGNDSFLGLTMGSYRVTRLIGAGGMGRVYRAVQPEIGGRVAIKVLSEACALEPRFQERFFAEARAVNLIRHEKIINIIDLARLPDGRPYIVMEFLDGSPLSAVFRGRGPLPLAPFVRLMLEVLDGVAAAHDKQVVHRDLKPDNIFVSPNGHATVLDFGIAKLTEGDHPGRTETGALLGTPKYMSPEQVIGLPADARADVYALGAILYEGVVGAPPFAPGSAFELMRQHLEVEPAPPRARRPDTPPALEAVILRALDKARGRRFDDARDMRNALLATLDELPHDSLDVVGRRSAVPADTIVDGKAPEELGTRTAPPRPLAEGDTARPLPETIAAAPLPLAEPTRAPRAVPVRALAVAAVLGVGLAGTLLFFRTRAPAHAAPAEPALAVAPPKPAPDQTTLTREQLADFDAAAWITTATAIAKKEFAPDAALTMIYLPVELPSGRVNLSEQGAAVYYFNAPSQRKADDGCATTVSFEARGIAARRYAEVTCDRPRLAAPRCTPAQVVKSALAGDLKGTKSKRGTISLMSVEPGGVRWAAVALDGSSTWIDDDCS